MENQYRNNIKWKPKTKRKLSRMIIDFNRININERESKRWPILVLMVVAMVMEVKQ